MRTTFKPLSTLFFAGLLTISIISTADAQRGGFHGGGGHFGGGYYHGGGYSHFGVGIGVGVGVGFGGYYSSFGYPRYGFIGALPYGYYPFFWGPYQYYYSGGYFYQPGPNGGYQVTAPPVGAEVPSLPKGASPINIDGVQYYEFNGVYYKNAVTPDGKKVFLVAGKDGVLNTNPEGITPPDSTATVDTAPPMPQVGDMTDQLPEGARKITLNGKKYWVTIDNIYLEEVKGQNGTSYRVVSVPEANNEQEDKDKQ
ncbi:DUF6515 family protein [Mucilaginibacter jinjuensis]|uniref:Uncharacterized protein n=1 Tax=Mucilaginibacter jinjuensis TaxID=1176721 RepID=A0ABY7T7Z4_9SPHI|nr:DUF6515 family protein [Mucilaginibacter jinjuensis]WCT12393.1 hypothetical protein PQO05_00410 [Mucilaginibacter jinjuensis]